MSAPQAGRLYPYSSLFAPNTQVTLDPWSPNICALDAQQAIPSTYALSEATGGEPPNMWTTGPLPPFTASGIDPSNLMLVPARCRHAAANDPDRGNVLAMIQELGNDPDAAVDDPDWQAYVARFRDWLGGRWINPDQTTAPDPAEALRLADAMYDDLFGAHDAAIAAKIASVAAANPPMPRTAADRMGHAQR